MVRLDGVLLAAQLALAVRAGEGLIAGAQVDRVLVVELRALRRHGVSFLLCCQWWTSQKAALIEVFAHDCAVCAGLVARQHDPDRLDDAEALAGERTPGIGPEGVAVGMGVLVSSHTFSPVVVVRCVGRYRLPVETGSTEAAYGRV